jgi:hypothetical protein
MTGALILGIALLIGFLLVAQWFVNADPKTIVRVARWVAGILGLAMVVALILTKAWIWLPILLFVVIPWLRQFRTLARMAKSARGPSAGRRSSVDTDYLEVFLDHDSGEMEGNVRRGAFAGRELSSLGLDDLLRLFAECRAADEQSAAVLAAYLDRYHPEWRDQAEDYAPGSGPSGGRMTVAEARQILGVDDDAGKAEIKDAHRRLMKQFHPDQGGSSYLAAKINEAKEILLGE